MSSLTRAVTSKFNGIAYGRQRLTTEKGQISPSTSELNYYIPPEVIWEDYEANKDPLNIDVETESKTDGCTNEKKSSPNIFSQKMTAVVRRLSPFNEENSTPKNKKSTPSQEENTQQKKAAFKQTKQKMGKMKNIRISKDKQQLIESSDEEF